jgi:hypothetical protein
MTLKLWDVAMERAPVLTLDVHDSLRSRLCELYESDLIFDKFECGWTAEGRCEAELLRCDHARRRRGSGCWVRGVSRARELASERLSQKQRETDGNEETDSGPEGPSPRLGSDEAIHPSVRP